MPSAIRPFVRALTALCAVVLPVVGAAQIISNVASADWAAPQGPQTVLSNRVDVTVVRRDPVDAGIFRVTDGGGRTSRVETSGCMAATQGVLAISNEGDQGTVSLEREDQFTVGETVVFGVYSPADNRDAAVRDTLVVRIATASGDEERLRLTEDAPDSSFFTGFLPTVATPPAPVHGDCRLSVFRNQPTGVTMIRDGDNRILVEAAISFLIDPFGVVFDSGDGAPVPGVRVTLINADTGQPAMVFGDDGLSPFPNSLLTGSTVTDGGGQVYAFPAGDYRFPLVAPGRYRLLVEPVAPYRWVSTATPAELAAFRRPGENLPYAINDGSYGGVFTLTVPTPVRVDIPIDRTGGAILLRKTAHVQTAAPGDVVRYRIDVTNPDTQRSTGAITVSDTLPPAMRLRADTLRYNDAPIAGTVSDDGRRFDLTLPALPRGGAGILTYLAEIRPDAQPGDAVNLASARDARGATSNRADAAVRIDRDVIGDRMVIIGRVTAGGCAVDPATAPGVPGVRVMMQDGSFAVTDSDGRYHFEGVRPGLHVVQLDSAALPQGQVAVDCARNVRTAGSAISRFVEGRGGELRRADFRIADADPASATPLARAAATIAPARPDPLDASTAAGAGRDWFAGQTPGIGWLFPTPDHNPRSSAVRIAIKHLPTQRVELAVNGGAVASVNFEGVTTSPDRRMAVSLWRGVELRDGDNRFVARVLNADGTLAETLEHVVHYSTQPMHAAVVADQSLLVADGVTRPVIAVRLTDRAGRPIRQGLVGDFSIAAPHRAAAELDAQQARQLAGLERARPTWRIAGDDGIAYIELEPTTASGSARISFTFRDEQISRQQDIDLWLNPGDRPWTIVGFAAGTLGYNTLDDRMEPVAEELDGDNLDGRVALYAKGRILGQWLMTMAYDSDREADEARFGGVIDPRAYYTVYADRADRGFDAASVRNLYLRLERPQFYALFGDFETGLNDTQLARYQRAMNGVRAEYRGQHVAANAFVADTPYRHRRDELQGSGLTGPYQLGARDILANSERVVIEVRDRLRGQEILATRVLVRHIDYDIDYFAGTLRFREPVLSRDSALNPQFIVADYEVAGVGQRVTNAGGRVTLTGAAERVRIGATMIHDETDRERTNLGAVDLRFRPDATTEIRAEYAMSSARATNGATGPDTRSHAWLVEAEHHGATFDILAYAREYAPDFGLGQINGASAATRTIGFDGRVRLTDALSLIGSAWHEDRLDTGANRQAGRLLAEYRADAMTLRAGLTHANDALAGGGRNRSTIAQLGATRRFFGDALELDAQTEFALGGDDASVDFPARHRFGARYAVSSMATLVGAYEIADGGTVDARTARFGVDMRPWAGARIAASGNRQDFVEFGARSYAAYGLAQSLQLSRDLSADVTVDGQRTLGGIRAADIVNVAHPVASGGYQEVNGALTEDFVALTAGATWRRDAWSLTGRAEYRDGELTDRIGVTLGGIRRIGEGRAAGGLFTWTRARAETGLATETLSAELSWAHRPADSRWSFLDKLEGRIDRLTNAVAGEPGPIGGPALMLDGDAQSARVINSLTINYSPIDRDGGSYREAGEHTLFWGLRYASDRIGSDDVSGWSTMVGADLRFDLASMVAVGVSGNVRLGTDARTVAWSGGPQIVLAPFANANIVIGYNLAGFRDRDFEDSRYSRAGAYVTVRMKIDQTMFDWLNR